MSDDPARPPRFPYVAALLCAACVGAAAWTWMRYSYCWQTSLADLYKEKRAARSFRRLDGMYVRFRCSPYMCTFADGTSKWVNMYFKAPWGHSAVVVPTEKFMEYTDETILVGRLRLPLPGSRFRDIKVDTNASRFTGASIAGLAVGAMGVFVFTVALRHWLRERRRFRERAKGA